MRPWHCGNIWSVPVSVTQSILNICQSSSAFQQHCLCSDFQSYKCDHLYFSPPWNSEDCLHDKLCRGLNLKRIENLLIIAVIIWTFPVQVSSHVCNRIQMFSPAPVKISALTCFEECLFSTFKMMQDRKISKPCKTTGRNTVGKGIILQHCSVVIIVE